MTDIQQHYQGFDMSGYGDGDDRTEFGNKFWNRLHNFNIFLGKVKEKNNYRVDDFMNFQLHSWKGNIWWGKSRFENGFDYGKEYVEKDFTGWTTDEIIDFILQHHLIEREKELIEEEEEDISRIITRDDRYIVLKRQRWRCNFCNCKLKFNSNSEWDGEIAHIDHIHPFSKKETYPNGAENINELSNLQALCPSCNLSKSSKEVN